jgi:hypothetical protein
LLPDYLLSLFTTNEQSLLGVKNVMARARAAQHDLPLDRQRLIIIPIAARDESNTEYERAAESRRRFARELSGFYDDWIHKDETAENVLDYLKIPYIAFWSFGEQLPVLEEEPSNPKTLAYSYALIARLIHGRLDWAEVREGREAMELQTKKAAEVQSALAEANKARIALYGTLPLGAWVGTACGGGLAEAALILMRRRPVRTREALERESAAYEIGHDRYADIAGEHGLRLFADRIERIAKGEVSTRVPALRARKPRRLPRERPLHRASVHPHLPSCRSILATAHHPVVHRMWQRLHLAHSSAPVRTINRPPLTQRALWMFS